MWHDYELMHIGRSEVDSAKERNGRRACGYDKVHVGNAAEEIVLINDVGSLFVSKFSGAIVSSHERS